MCKMIRRSHKVFASSPDFNNVDQKAVKYDQTYVISVRLSHLYTSRSRLRSVSPPEHSLQRPADISPVYSLPSPPAGETKRRESVFTTYCMPLLHTVLMRFLSSSSFSVIYTYSVYTQEFRKPCTFIYLFISHIPIASYRQKKFAHVTATEANVTTNAVGVCCPLNFKA